MLHAHVIRFWLLPYFLSFVTISLAEDQVCPVPMSEKYNGSDNSFEYQSWNWPRKDSTGYIFCNCLRNEDDKRALFVDWKETGLMGFVRPKRSMYAYVTSGISQSKHIDVDLWFGPQPKRLKTKVVTPDVTTEAEKVISPQALPQGQTTHQTTPSLSGARDMVVVSKVNLALPPVNLQLRPGSIRKLLINAAEERPDALANVEFVFRSKAVRDETDKTIVGIRQECDYRIEYLEGAVGSWGAAYFLKIDDPALHEVVFHTNKPVILDLNGAREIVIKFGGLSVANIGQGELKVRHGRVSVLGSGDESLIIGSMPFSYLSK